MHNILTTLLIVLITSNSISLFGMELGKDGKKAKRVEQHMTALDQLVAKGIENKKPEDPNEARIKARLALVYAEPVHEFGKAKTLSAMSNKQLAHVNAQQFHKSRSHPSIPDKQQYLESLALFNHPSEYHDAIQLRRRIFIRSISMIIRDATSQGKIVYANVNKSPTNTVFFISEGVSNDIFRIFAAALCSFKETPAVIRLNTLENLYALLLQYPIVYTALDKPRCIVQNDILAVPLLQSSMDLDLITLQEGINGVGNYSGKDLREIFMERINNLLAKPVDHIKHMDKEKFETLLNQLKALKEKQKPSAAQILKNKLRSFSNSPLQELLSLSANEEEESLAVRLIKELRAKLAARKEAKEKTQAKI